MHGRAILYADTQTDSMRRALDETSRRRARQERYNEEHGITPQSVVRQIDDVMSSVYERDYVTIPRARDEPPEYRTTAELHALIARLDTEMKAAAANLAFEKAAALRDRIKTLRVRDLALAGTEG